MVETREKGPYTVHMKRSAERELRKITPPDLQRVVRAIGALAANPRPRGLQKLAGTEAYRIRQGDYRIVYEVDDEERTVQIIKVGHRREVYR